MLKNKIIYDQKFDNKILMAFIIPVSVIAIIGTSIFCISKQIYKEDISSFLILMFTPIILSFLAFIPCIIIGRYKFIIDLDNQILIFRGYFKRIVQYNLVDIEIKKRVKNPGNQWVSTTYNVDILCDYKKICTIDSGDFEAKTKESLLIIFREQSNNTK